MNYNLVENDTTKYIEIVSSDVPLRSEQDALDIISLSWEHDINMLLIHGYVLSEDFFDLKTGVAGKMLQKFINYNIKVGAIIPSQIADTGRFREMVLEANKGNAFRVFTGREEAENWLLSI